MEGLQSGSAKRNQPTFPFGTPATPFMKSLFLTNEFPPTIYGGAGVHVDYLSKELAKLMEVEARCYGQKKREPREQSPTLKAMGYGVDTSGYTAPKPLHSVFGAVQ